MVRSGVAGAGLMACVALGVVVGCQSASTSEPAAERPAMPEMFLPWMVGSFSSGAQAKADPENYFDIRLEMVRIWPEREDAMWLYVEQAAASALERPYRQRVYRVRWAEPDEGCQIVSEVYTFEEPLEWAGAWREPGRFGAMSPSDLMEREGCAVYLSARPVGSEHDADRFDGEWCLASTVLSGADTELVGSTRGDGCSSSLGGASYATSEVTWGPDVLTSWDRGFDAAGNQVWGATEGAYMFVRESNVPE